MSNKRFQFLRGKTIYASMEAAKSALATKVATLLPGEPAIAYYHTKGAGVDGDEVLALFGVGGTPSGSTVFYDSHSVDAAIASAQAAASTEVIEGAGVTVSKEGGENGVAAQYTVAANLTMQYNPAVPASDGADAKPATITLKSAVREGEAQVTYGTVNVSDIVGNGVLDNSSYDSETGILTLNFKNASGGTTPQTVDLKQMLDLNDVVIGEGSQNYLSASASPTSGETGQFILGTKMVAVSAANDSNTGLVDAKDVKDYVDAAVAGKNVSASGDSVFITATASGNSVTVTGTYGTFTSVGASETDGIAKVSGVAGAIAGAIGKLDATVSSDTTNVNVTISEVGGKLTGVTVTEDYATVSVDGTNLTVNNDSCLVKGSDITTVGTYASNLVSAEATARANAINALSAATVGGTGKIITAISETAGVISATSIDLTASAVAATAFEATDNKVAVSGTTVDAQIDSLATSVKAAMNAATASIEALDKDEATVSGTNVSFKYSESDGIVTISGLSETYATVTTTAWSSKAPATAPTLTVSGDAGLATGADIKKVANYVDSKIDKQAHDVKTTIEGLDATISQSGVTASGNNVNIIITEVDGKLTGVTASVDSFDCGEWE